MIIPGNTLLAMLSPPQELQGIPEEHGFGELLAGIEQSAATLPDPDEGEQQALASVLQALMGIFQPSSTPWPALPAGETGTSDARGIASGSGPAPAALPGLVLASGPGIVWSTPLSPDLADSAGGMASLVFPSPVGQRPGSTPLSVPLAARRTQESVQDFRGVALPSLSPGTAAGSMQTSTTAEDYSIFSTLVPGAREESLPEESSPEHIAHETSPTVTAGDRASLTPTALAAPATLAAPDLPALPVLRAPLGTRDGQELRLRPVSPGAATRMPRTVPQELAPPLSVPPPQAVLPFGASAVRGDTGGEVRPLAPVLADVGTDISQTLAPTPVVETAGLQTSPDTPDAVERYLVDTRQQVLRPPPSPAMRAVLAPVHTAGHPARSTLEPSVEPGPVLSDVVQPQATPERLASGPFSARSSLAPVGGEGWGEGAFRSINDPPPGPLPGQASLPMDPATTPEVSGDAPVPLGQRRPPGLPPVFSPEVVGISPVTSPQASAVRQEMPALALPEMEAATVDARMAERPEFLVAQAARPATSVPAREGAVPPLAPSQAVPQPSPPMFPTFVVRQSTLPTAASAVQEITSTAQAQQPTRPLVSEPGLREPRPSVEPTPGSVAPVAPPTDTASAPTGPYESHTLFQAPAGPLRDREGIAPPNVEGHQAPLEPAPTALLALDSSEGASLRAASPVMPALVPQAEPAPPEGVSRPPLDAMTESPGHPMLVEAERESPMPRAPEGQEPAPAAVTSGQDVPLDRIFYTPPRDTTATSTAVPSDALSVPVPPPLEDARPWPRVLSANSLLLRLEPRELGELLVQVRVSDKRLVASFRAQSPEAEAILRTHLPALHDALSQHGFEVQPIHLTHAPEGFHTSLGSGGGTGAFTQQQSAFHTFAQEQPGRSGREPQPEGAPLPPPRWPVEQRPRLLDVVI